MVSAVYRLYNTEVSLIALPCRPVCPGSAGTYRSDCLRVQADKRSVSSTRISVCVYRISYFACAQFAARVLVYREYAGRPICAAISGLEARRDLLSQADAARLCALPTRERKYSLVVLGCKRPGFLNLYQRAFSAARAASPHAHCDCFRHIAYQCVAVIPET
ncbi:MAG: hypothetical protein DELT_03231 [Desulfovibrio sp.]